MDQKPIHYDGSVQPQLIDTSGGNEPFQMTDEMRKSIGQNPYSSNTGQS